MFSDLDSVDWTKIITEELSSDEMASQFYETLWPKFETLFSTNKSSIIIAWPTVLSPFVKRLLKKRKQAMRTNDEEIITRLQNQINRLIHSNQVNAVKNEKNGSTWRNGGVKWTVWLEERETLYQLDL
jgi:short subunit fatty acids transporter